MSGRQLLDAMKIAEDRGVTIHAVRDYRGLALYGQETNAFFAKYIGDIEDIEVILNIKFRKDSISGGYIAY